MQEINIDQDDTNDEMDVDDDKEDPLIKDRNKIK